MEIISLEIYIILVVIILSINILKRRKVEAKLLKAEEELESKAKEKSCESSLRQQEEPLNEILQTIMDGLFILNMNGDIINVNEAYMKMVGYSKEELLKMSIYDLEAKESREETQKHLKQIKMINQDRFETKHRCKNGDIINIEISTTYYVNSLDNHMVVSFCRDITERKKEQCALEKAYRDNEEFVEELLKQMNRTNTILKTSMDAFWVMDTSGDILETNEAFMDLFGYELLEVMNMNISDLAIAKDQIEIKKQLEKIKRLGQSRFEDKYCCKDGKAISLEISVTFVDSLDEPMFVVFARDITERKREQRALEKAYCDNEEFLGELLKQKNRINTILKTSMDAFWVMDTNGDILETNEAFMDLFGYELLEVMNMNVSDLAIAKDQREVKKQLEKIKRLGQSRFEDKYCCKDGKVINLEISVTFVDSLDEPIYVVFARDITERKETENALKESEAKFRSYIDNAPYGVFVVDDKAKYIDVNKAACQLVGYSEDELLNMSITDLLTLESKEKGKQDFSNLIKTGNEENNEYLVIRKSGNRIYVNVNLVKLSEDKYLGFAKDITKRKEAEIELKKEKEKLKKYLDISEVIFLILNLEGKVKAINKKGSSVLGYYEEETIDKEWMDNFVAKESKEGLEEPLKVITKTGEKRKLIARDTILKDEAGEVEGMLISGIDITEREKLKEELEYNKLQIEFFANLSHELKTPLNLIFSALQMLELYQKNNLETETYQKTKRYTKVIKQNGYRLLRLVNNLIDITKINSNSFDLNLKNYDIVNAIREITYSVENYVENKDRILEFNSNIERKVIACDPFNIERIILNLLSNAIKFTEEGDKIAVNIYDKGDRIFISIKDTGVGIPKKNQEMIFERFRQVDKSFTRNSEGSGIGLSIVKLLVELHNGKITVDSKLGEFTEFMIEMPVEKLIIEDDVQFNSKYNMDNLVDKIEVEFSDVYGL